MLCWRETTVRDFHWSVTESPCRARFPDYCEAGEYIPSNPGNIIELSTGKVVGQHDGLWRFTVGQRARIMSMPDKAFVAGKDVARNEIHVVLGT